MVFLTCRLITWHLLKGDWPATDRIMTKMEEDIASTKRRHRTARS